MKKLLLTVVTLFIAHAGFSDEMPQEVKRLKTLRDRQVAEKTKKIDAIYHRELNKLKEKYAAQGNYIAAAYIDKMLIDAIDAQAKNKQLTNNETETAAQNQDAEVYYKEDTMRLKEGARVWSESMHRRIKVIPDGFEDKEISAMAVTPREGGGDDPVYKPVPFKVKKAGMVYIITNAGKSDTFTEDGWKVVAKGIYTVSNRKEIGYDILSKFLGVGEYTLPITEGFGTRLIDM